MQVVVIPCGPAANESERKAVAHLENSLKSEPGQGEWILLTNLRFSPNPRFQSDEIDILAIGPPGVRVVEVKHWTAQWINQHSSEVEEEAKHVAAKAQKIGTTLRKILKDVGFVGGAILLTQEPSKLKSLAGKEVRGVTFCTLNAWREAIGVDLQPVLSPLDVRRLSQLLEPRSPVAIDGSLRRLAGYVNLELQTPKDERFHRVYKGSHPSRRDRIVLHLYDLSASDDKQAEEKARREYEALHRLQLYPWAPRILDSYQPVPGYAGEMFFFTVVDPAAPTLQERAADQDWSTNHRLEFARSAVRALKTLHQPEAMNGEPLIHRNLTPKTILVKHDNSPILTGFYRARIPSELSVASSSPPSEADCMWAAPEVRSLGLAGADCRSDVYSLCACLRLLFEGRNDEASQRALEALERGLAEDREQRCSLEDLETYFSQLLGEPVPPPPAPLAPPARFWTEDQIVQFRDRNYRIVTRLGSGGVGTAFKVIEVHGDEELGTYVAKVAHDREVGQRVLRAYSLVRPHLARHPSLSAIFEVATEWKENQFVALMTWVEGMPLSEFAGGDLAGLFPELAEDLQEASAESLAVRWIRDICEALDQLHRNGLIHGDVSPRNLIVSGSSLVLTDYDFVAKVGERITAPGTVIYCSPSCEEGQAASPSDDFYALAASFFHVLFEREPFRWGAALNKRRGLNWEGLERDSYPALTAFLERATHPDASQRFKTAAQALEALATPVPAEGMADAKDAQPIAVPVSPPPTPAPALASAAQAICAVEVRKQRNDWLPELLQSYPGSRWGNRETRGLDTAFAAQTYVETALEETLLTDIHRRRVRLVVLSGNAGDGKTALLQHLAQRLGLGKRSSSERILSGRLHDGLEVRMNLDGSASWKGRSADEILDEFLAPFQDGQPHRNIVCLLAINDGRLLEWIEGVKQRRGHETPLIRELYELLQQEAVRQESYIRFINLNQRSLVGGVTRDGKKIETGFLEQLLDHLYGGQKAADKWAPCQSCSSQQRCQAFQAACIFGPEPSCPSTDPRIRRRARERLCEALQAVHLRGETHITVRELRAALVYILFGTHSCNDYHAGAGEDQHFTPYWDRAFAADSPHRQGEVLRELARFDPALEAHPKIDRYLLARPIADSSRTAPHYPELTLGSARRRAFFEWLPEHIEEIAGDADALGLARGRHLRLFRDLPLADEQQRTTICERLCAGISRLQDLPPQALEKHGVVPLRISQRTPTETIFWVEKPLDAFRVEPDLPETEGVERLHRQISLIYRYRDSDNEERLRVGAELFHLLLELSEGYQLGDVSTDDTFAHLSIFVQRLVRENERDLRAWNPMQDDAIYRVAADIRQSETGPKQILAITRL